jgi:ClpP class serine protease
MWLLEQKTKAIIEKAESENIQYTSEQLEKFVASFDSESGDMPRIMSKTGEIRIEGVLTKAPNFLAMLFGGGNTTYSEIIAAIAVAETDTNIENITLLVDSPGGSVDGLFAAVDAIKAAKKPVTAKIVNIAASAAYALAAQADWIIAENRGNRVGSIGVVAGFIIDENEVVVTSSNAPNKVPDVTTEEGKAVVRNHLDDIEALFIGSISAGRKTTAKEVISNFGKGSMLLAENALSVGMIDAIESINKKPQTTSGKTKAEVKNMDLGKLKAEHREIYEAAKLEGTTQERDRAKAHLVMGESSGDMKTAIAAINDGSEMTATLTAAYMSATMNKNDISNRDDDETAAAAAAAAAEESGKDDETVVALVEEKLGIERKSE